ncbi:MAG: hypothetical protein ACRDNJ_06015, partial [Solirubrobacteraceae bacterium]
VRRRAARAAGAATASASRQTDARRATRALRRAPVPGDDEAVEVTPVQHQMARRVAALRMLGPSRMFGQKGGRRGS